MKYIHCSKDYRVIEDSFDEKDWSGYHEDEYYNHYFYLSDKQNYNEFECSIESSSKLYVLAVIYYDGGSFGKTLGYHKIIQVSSNLKYLEEIAESIRNNTFNKVKDCKDCQKNKCYTHYKVWNGYFAGLQDIIIQELVEEKYKKSYL